MTENLSETDPPEWPPKPLEVPNPTEPTGRAKGNAYSLRAEDQRSAHQSAWTAMQAEFAKATSHQKAETQQPLTSGKLAAGEAAPSRELLIQRVALHPCL